MNGFYDSKSRFRNFAFIGYEESLVDDWLEQLRESKVPFFVSPLHDKDVWTLRDEKKNPDHKAGTFKKPHLHIMLMFEGPKSPVAIYKQFVHPLGGVGVWDNDFNDWIPEIVSDRCAMARYLCHLDDDDKALYDPELVICGGGSDYQFACDLPRDTARMLADITDFIDKNNVFSYAALLIWVRNYKSEWLVCCQTHTLYLTSVIKSVTWTANSCGDIHDLISNWTY